ncbi:MAG: sporulation protein YunB [Oscillospiraceae bacterium]|nr:sporulation protein YunB [Oscillospiraceae bacterium]
MLFRHRPKYVHENGLPGEKRPRRARPLVALLCFAAAGALLSGFWFLRDLSTQIAVSDAEDIVTMSVNSAVNQLLSANDYGADYFVTVTQNNAGEVTAVSCDMVHINSFSAALLDKVIHSTESGALIVNVPAGNLTGSSLLMGRGPEVPIRIIYLTSSAVQFKNDIVSAGINQTKLQLSLEVTVNVDVLIPWNTRSSQIVTDVLIADTVVVGKVPDTFVKME